MRRGIDDNNRLILYREDIAQRFAEGSIIKMIIFIKQGVSLDFPAEFRSDHVVRCPMPVRGEDLVSRAAVAGDRVAQCAGTARCVAGFDKEILRDFIQKNCLGYGFLVFRDTDDRCISREFFRAQFMQCFHNRGKNDQLAVVIQQNAEGRVDYVFFADLGNACFGQRADAE